MLPPAPASRVQVVNDAAVRGDGAYVLYWMTAQRRLRSNPALQHAVHLAGQLGLPLLILEPLDIGYRWASERHHRFVIEGMADTAAALRGTGIGYLPYVEPEPGAGRGLLAALASRAALVVADQHPGYRWPRILERGAARVDRRLVAIDGCGVLPLTQAPRTYKRAVDFRRYVHKAFAAGGPARPVRDPLDERLPALGDLPHAVLDRWEPADLDALLATGGLAPLGLPDLAPVPDKPGGSSAAAARAERFLSTRLPEYPHRNHPDREASSGLSPWLHFGHISAAELVWRVLDDRDWTPANMNAACVAKQRGAWGLSEPAEGFLEELITWRELAMNGAHRDPDFESYAGLPDWARVSLAEHRDDPRPALVPLEDLAESRSPDPLWNAAQRELRETGVMQNYLRMLWGKLVLAWTPTPRDAWDVLVDLNNRYALDGRDPNSYAGIGWVFGRYDRAWGPERPIYGKVRYMTSGSTRRKLRLSAYIDRWSR